MEAAENYIRTPVCIVGAGPAGVAASMRLSSQGISHILVDASEFPRHKSCGDIITSGVIRALNRLDPEIIQGLKSSGSLNPIWQSHIYPPGEKALTLDFKPLDRIPGEAGCYSVSRHSLDAALLENVRKCSLAVLKEGCRVKSLEFRKDGVFLGTEGGSGIFAELVILATGSGSQLPAKAGFPIPDEDCAVGIRAHYENVVWPDQQTALFLYPDCMPGGLYITPLPGGKCNVNLVISLRKARKEKTRLRELMDAHLASIPQLKEAFARARISGNPEGSRLFLGLRKRRVSRERLLLAGDAAGLIEFFSGNGIPQAYGSGMLAADVAVQAVLKGDFSSGYLREYDRLLHQKYMSGRLLARFFFKLLHRPMAGRFMLRFLSFLASKPHSNQLLLDLLYHPKPLWQFLNPIFWNKLIIRGKSSADNTMAFPLHPDAAAEQLVA